MNDIVKSEKSAMVAMEFTEPQVDLIKRTVAKGTTNDELALFLYTAKKTGLDPLIRQIYAVKRNTKNGPIMSIQTGIDGYRLIAERSGKYAPGKEPTYQYDKSGKILSATAYVNKLVGNVWHEVAATAFYAEYVNATNPIWIKMPHAMLAKCAEALALRKAFPAEMAGVYTKEEMEQADVEVKTTIAKSAPLPPEKSEKPVDAEIVKDEPVDLAAKAEEAKKRLDEAKAQEEAQKAHEQATEAPKTEVKHDALPQTSVQETVRGLVTDFYERKGRGPFAWRINGKFVKSFDANIAETINQYKASGAPIEVLCQVSQYKETTNLMVMEIVKREKDDIMEGVAF